MDGAHKIESKQWSTKTRNCGALFLPPNESSAIAIREEFFVCERPGKHFVDFLWLGLFLGGF